MDSSCVKGFIGGMIVACAMLIVSFVGSQAQLASNTMDPITGPSVFYVSVDGVDANPGSLVRPWRTIQHAVNAVSPGATINVREGLYHESVIVRVSGASTGGYITLRSYPGEKAVLDGSNLAIAENAQSGLFNLHDQSYITIEGFELRNYATDDGHRIAAGIYIDGAGSNIKIIGNHIHHISTHAKGGLCSGRESGTANAFGIVVYGTRAPQSLSRILIQDNEVDHLHTGCSESVVVNGNVENWIVSGNTIHDNDNIGIDAIGFEKVSPDARYDQARGGSIRENVIYNITAEGNAGYGKNDLSADGIYVDGGASITIERNRIRNTDIGIELASEARGGNSSYIVVRNNLIYRSNAAGMSIGGYAPNRGGADHCTIVNNTLVENDTHMTGSGEFQIQYHAAENIFKNNLLFSGEQNLAVNNLASSRTSPAVVDANLYASHQGAESSKWRWRGTDYQGFANYRARSGQDAHSFFSDPLFVDGNADDFRPAVNSPGLEKGEDLGQILGAFDYAGGLRVHGDKVDIGAYEH
jgi:Right handed beta helix region